MKKITISILLIISAALSLRAQTTVTTVVKHRLDEHTVIKDSSGMVYPYLIWKKLISSGNYNLRPVDPYSDSTVYIIVKQNEAERNRMLSRMPRPQESKFFTDGEKISLFNTSDINGKKLKLKEMAGKVIVLNFWFIGCPPCRMEIPELDKLAHKYADNPNVVFVAVCLDQDYQIEDLIKGTPFSYHIVDRGQEYADMYKINLYPTNVVLDKEGKVKFHASGYTTATPYWIGKTIDEALQGQ